MEKRLLSGIQATGAAHIGNYFGAMKQFVDLQDSHESFFMIADLHSLTTVKDKDKLQEYIFNVALDYLAIGIDPEKSVIFRQSDIPQHTELTWVFNCITTMPYLMRAHAFKDAEAKSKEVNIGLFDYPMLMSADILLYDPHVVPVGDDQKQHIEFARDTAEKFNHLYGDTFMLPEAHILKRVGTIPGIDGRKMSKSYNNHIPLFAEGKELEKLVMSIVTDSKTPEEKKNPDEDIVFQLHKLFTPAEKLAEIEKGYREGGLGYGDSKKMLVESINEYMEPMRKRRKEYEQNPARVFEILEKGSKIAGDVAKAKMIDVKRKVGLAL